MTPAGVSGELNKSPYVPYTYPVFGDNRSKSRSAASFSVRQGNATEPKFPLSSAPLQQCSTWQFN